MTTEKQATLTVLLVEDSAPQREATRLFLEGVDSPCLSILEAATGQDGLNILSACHVDCILLDFQLPDMNGLDFMDNMYTINMDFIPPVIIVTGHGNEHIAVQAIKNGADDYIVKTDNAKHLELLPFVIDKAYREKFVEYEKRQVDSALWTAVHDKDAVLEAIEEGVIGLDKNSNILFINPAANRILGISNTQSTTIELKGLIRQLGHDKLNNFIVDNLLECVAKGDACEGTFKASPVRLGGTKDEPDYNIHFTSRPVTDQENLSSGAIIVLEKRPS